MAPSVARSRNTRVVVSMPRTPDLAGRALDGRYELHAVIGEGAFGRVYRGHDRRLARAVAVKVIKPWWAEDSAWVERFEREAQLLARVSDPGVVQIFDIGHAEEGPYYVAELVEGESLSERLRRGPLPPARARGVAEQLCRALASAHAQGVVHCDVKPANVLLSVEGIVKVGDFGIARLAAGTSQALSATIAGTPRYMSPEQARGQPTTPATDVYSAGVVLYEMLAGEPPFAQGSPVELGLRHLQERPPPLAERVPVALRRVVERALEKDPGERYPDGAAMAAALARADCSPAQRAGASEPHDGGQEGRRLTSTARGEGTMATAVLSEPATIALTASQTLDAAALPPRPPNAPPRRRPPSGPPERNVHDSAHRRRRVALLAGLLVLAGGALALILLGRPAHTTVPELRGLPRGGVQARARRLHVQPAFSKRYSAATAGVAISQTPSPGVRIAEGSTVQVVLSAGPPPVRVPGVVGQSSSSAESAIADAGLRYGVTTVARPGSHPGVVLSQAPGPASTVAHGSTVALSVAEAPRWRTLTSFSGTDDGHSVPFRILGSHWRLHYNMSYTGTCLLVVVCFGPSAEARNLGTGAGAGSFELGEGSSETHTFNGGPGLYRVAVSGGRDSAGWSMTVQDYY
jgi:eukaryotic-like serine/threonine-protein kinase